MLKTLVKNTGKQSVCNKKWKAPKMTAISRTHELRSVVAGWWIIFRCFCEAPASNWNMKLSVQPPPTLLSHWKICLKKDTHKPLSIHLSVFVEHLWHINILQIIKIKSKPVECKLFVTWAKINQLIAKLGDKNVTLTNKKRMFFPFFLAHWYLDMQYFNRMN